MKRKWILNSAAVGVIGLVMMISTGCETGQQVIDTTIKPVSATIDGLGQLMFPTKYEPKWESLDTRKTPEWFSDAKFGIFIHWGVYSVPAWGPKGTYAEWYWRNAFQDDGKTLKDDQWGQYHKQTYGEKFPYADFAPKFTCDKYNPDEWADLFEKAGAKYVVLTSKHHEGFTLWPNAEASKTWGRPWNAVEVGPKRDILGDLSESVRHRGIKMGYYYSLYEWFNPLWLSDRPKYVSEHMIPQVKDLVNRYKPDILWGDGEWDMTDKDWGSEAFLAWLFNESPVKNTIAINDRWGKDVRHKHGGYYTTEYGAGLKDASHPWEECRGMGHSFGYNSNEGPDDYKSVRELLLVLIDLTSRGGCLLLDIGPTKEGQIPAIMQERLLGMGDWLKVNGEAIYGTRMYKTSCQWSEGQQPEQEYKDYKVKYNVLDVVGQPKDGKAVKQAFFTTKSYNTLYAILPTWPGKEFVLKDVTPESGVKVTLLGRDGELPWKKVEGGMAIDLSSIDENKLPCQVAWTLKIKGKL